MSELKPCPFCGDSMVKQYGGGLSQESTITVCTGCFTQVIGHELWNNRPYENKIKADAIRQALHWRPSEAYDGDSVICFAYEYADKLEKGEL